MISKELLSEVLCINEHMCGVYEINFIENEEIYFKYDMFGIKAVNKINIYELAHKCKEWAWFEHSYQISSMFINLIFRTGKELSEAPQCQSNMWNDNGEFIDYFDAKTEPEAIFKACQWILDNKDKQ